MLTETAPTTTRELTAAERWAQELRDEFSLSLGHDCPFEVTPGLDSHGEYQVTVAGVVLSAEKRSWWPVHIREYVASQLAAPAPSQSTLQWFEWPYELIGFIGWMHEETFLNDPVGFRAWLDHFRGKMWKWTVEFIEFKAATR